MIAQGVLFILLAGLCRNYLKMAQLSYLNSKLKDTFAYIFNIVLKFSHSFIQSDTEKSQEPEGEAVGTSDVVFTVGNETDEDKLKDNGEKE